MLLLSLCGVAYFADPARAQSGMSRDPHFEHYSNSDGLSSAQIKNIVQDSIGFIWVGTPDGLNRFDGRQFNVYRHQPGDSNSLTNNIVNQMTVDAQGRVWVATNNGLCFFDYADGLFHSIDINRSNEEQFDRNRVYGVFAGKDKKIWYSTVSELHLLHADGRITSYPLPAEMKANINCVSEDDKGRAWVGTNLGMVLVYDPRYKTSVKISLDDSSNVNGLRIPAPVCSICQETENSFLIGTWSQGMRRISESDGRFSVSVCSGKNDHRQLIARAICPAAGGRSFWVAMYGRGLGLYDPSSNRFLQRLHHREDDVTSLCSEYVNTVFTDKAGILWVGTDEGLDKYDTLVNRFFVLRISALQHGQSAPPHLVDLLPDKRATERGTIWLAVSGVGLVHYCLTTGVRRIYRHPDPLDATDNAINCLFQDEAGNLWLGGKEGLIRFDSQTGKFTDVSGACGFPGPHSVSSIIQDSKGIIWIATYTNGVYRYNVSADTWTVYRHNPSVDGTIADDHVFCILEDAAGRIWAGTQNQGLCMLDTPKGQWRHFGMDLKNPNSLPDNNVYALQEDRTAGKLWIATEDGLAAMNLRDFGLHSYSTADGLCNNDVFAITRAANGHLWLATNNGISDFDPRSEKFRNYYRQDGLPQNSFSEGFRCLSNGNMLLAFPGGLVQFNSVATVTNRRAPTVVITGCKILDKDYPLSIRSGRPEKLSMTYRQNMVTFEFAALNFTHANNNNYAYWLEGFDKGWIYSGGRSSATYTNLDGGNYIFHVKAANNDGVWNNDGVFLALTVNPPFRKTWVFYVLLVIIVLAAFYILYHYRVAHMMQIQRVRADIARDLHDDIGSTLSSIFMMSRMGLKNSNNGSHTERPAELLTTISRASQQAMELMGDIVWSVNPANDSVERIAVRMREYAAELLDASEIRLDFDCGPGVEHSSLSLNRRKELYLIFKEAVNNLARHSRASNAWIRISSKSNFLELVVADNGIGLNRARAEGNGLRNMAERANRLAAQLQVNSRPAGGTIVTLILPMDAPSERNARARAGGAVS